MKYFFVIIFSTFSLAQANECRSVFAEERASYFELQLAQGQFRDDRNYAEYLHILTSPEISFSKALQVLPKDSLWIDMGAGLAYALTGGLEKNLQLNGIAISYKRPVHLKMSAPYVTDLGKRFQYLDGDYIENMAAGGRLDPWMGKVVVITDVFGPFSYTNDIVRILQIHFDLLAPEGRLFFYFNNDRTKLNRQGSLEDTKISEWLHTIPGIEVKLINTLHHNVASTGGVEEVVSVQIVKKSLDVRVPQTLILKDIQYDSPVRRRYEWK